MKLENKLHPLLNGAKTEQATEQTLLMRLLNTISDEVKEEAFEDKDFWRLIREKVSTGQAVLVSKTKNNPGVGIAKL